MVDSAGDVAEWSARPHDENDGLRRSERSGGRGRRCRGRA